MDMIMLTTNFLMKGRRYVIVIIEIWEILGRNSNLRGISVRKMISVGRKGNGA